MREQGRQEPRVLPGQAVEPQVLKDRRGLLDQAVFKVRSEQQELLVEPELLEQPELLAEPELPEQPELLAESDLPARPAFFRRAKSRNS